MWTGAKSCAPFKKRLVLPFKKARDVRTRPDDQIKRPAAAAALSVHLGFDYGDFIDVPSDVRRWVKVLRVRLF